MYSEMNQDNESCIANNVGYAPVQAQMHARNSTNNQTTFDTANAFLQSARYSETPFSLNTIGIPLGDAQISQSVAGRGGLPSFDSGNIISSGPLIPSSVQSAELEPMDLAACYPALASMIDERPNWALASDSEAEFDQFPDYYKDRGKWKKWGRLHARRNKSRHASVEDTNAKTSQIPAKITSTGAGVRLEMLFDPVTKIWKAPEVVLQAPQAVTSESAVSNDSGHVLDQISHHFQDSLRPNPGNYHQRNQLASNTQPQCARLAIDRQARNHDIQATDATGTVDTTNTLQLNEDELKSLILRAYSLGMQGNSFLPERTTCEPYGGISTQPWSTPSFPSVPGGVLVIPSIRPMNDTQHGFQTHDIDGFVDPHSARYSPYSGLPQPYLESKTGSDFGNNSRSQNHNLQDAGLGFSPRVHANTLLPVNRTTHTMERDALDKSNHGSKLQLHPRRPDPNGPAHLPLVDQNNSFGAMPVLDSNSPSLLSKPPFRKWVAPKHQGFVPQLPTGPRSSVNRKGNSGPSAFGPFLHTKNSETGAWTLSKKP